LEKTTFGIVITTYIGDFFLTKALLASLKKFAPNIPICVIQDGDFDLSKEKVAYNITHVIRKQDVKDDFLRENCFGSRCTNMIAFWESPFEKFLYLDSDLVMWGNILDHLDYENYDFIYNSPHEPFEEKSFKYQYFDYDRLFDFFEPIQWKNFNFFNAGVFVAKKGIFDLTLFKKLYFKWKEDKSLMPAEPQGMINYMAFHYFEKNSITIKETPLQTVVPVFSINELESSFRIINNEPKVLSPTIIHWAGIKPTFANRSIVFTRPEEFFRILHLKNIRSLGAFVPQFVFALEERVSLLKRYYKGNPFLFLGSKIKRIL